jgi:hypothetical protein
MSVSETLEGNGTPDPRYVQPRRTRLGRPPNVTNKPFFSTLRTKLRPRQRTALEHQFPARFPWADGEWQAKMTAWHYTMRKHKTLRWLRSMQRRHSESTHTISLVKDTQVIYALYHISLPRRLYVGQTINSAFTRFQEQRFRFTRSDVPSVPFVRAGLKRLTHSTNTWHMSDGKVSGFSLWRRSRGNIPEHLLA